MRDNASGFTLVELAIVLMIIGLLIGGILRGQEMMENARVAATLQQVKAYKGAIVTFRDHYGALPGDLIGATARIPNCTGAMTCANGNGDGLIGVPRLPWLGGNYPVSSENVQLWKHLALVHLISGIDPSAQTLAWGSSMPVAKIGGGFTALQSSTAADPGDVAAFNGLTLRIHNDFNFDEIEHSPVVTPHEGGLLDRKIDDGLPFSGQVRGASPGRNPGNNCEVDYQDTIEGQTCVMHFIIL